MTRPEIEKGLRLILATADGAASDEAVLDFLSFAVHRKIDCNAMWIADVNGRIVWALLPIVSPGRTMLLMTPGRLFRQTPAPAIGLLADAVCAHHARQGVVLAQVLLDPHDPSVRERFRGAGFDDLAELIYLQRAVLHEPEMPALPRPLELLGYSEQTHAAFSGVIQRSYQGSLDCPALSGVRRIEDVIAGHKAAGTFDPSMWFLLNEGGCGRGVLLLNPSTHVGTVELVYLGLVPEARGRRLGDLLMKLALATVGSRDFMEITLAVDSRNAPALGLYYRHGARRVGSRIALVRALSDAEAPHPAET